MSEQGGVPTYEQIRHAAVDYFARATAHTQLTVTTFAHFLGVEKKDVARVFTPRQWTELRDGWCYERLQRAMEVLYRDATWQEDFSATRIAQWAGVTPWLLTRLVGEEWRTRKATLPTPRTKVLAVLQALVEKNIPVAELTPERVWAAAGVPLQEHHWFTQARHASYLQLLERQAGKDNASSSTGLPPLVDGQASYEQESEVWDLRPAGGRVLRRDRLRPDIACIAWPLFWRELHAGDIPIGRVAEHYDACVHLRSFLGTALPDLPTATLEALQRAWVAYNGSLVQRKRARLGLLLLFDALIHMSEASPIHNEQELHRMTSWLRTAVTIQAPKSSEEFLSKEEVTAVLTHCLTDIAIGIAFTENTPEWMKMSTRHNAKESAIAVVRWAVALMLVVMAFTGLRRQSVLEPVQNL